MYPDHEVAIVENLTHRQARYHRAAQALGVPPVRRSVWLVLYDQPDGWNASKLARELGLPRRTVGDHLATMIRNRTVERKGLEVRLTKKGRALVLMLQVETLRIVDGKSAGYSEVMIAAVQGLTGYSVDVARARRVSFG